MKIICLLVLLSASTLAAAAQSAAVKENLQKVYDAEKAFERTAAERDVRQAFLAFTTADATCFLAGPGNCHETWGKRASTTAELRWNPNIVDVSANGVLAYTTGNSIYKPNGKDDPQAFYGQYATVWQRQPDGNYRAVLDIGISHDKPAAIETKWRAPADAGAEPNEKRSSAADASTQFYEMAAKQDLSRAYKAYLADDVRLLRDGRPPIDGKKAALEAYKNFRSKIDFAKRTMFVGAADLAYVSNSYTISDRAGKETEKGSFLQVWKLRGNRWQIVLDVFLPVKN